MWRNVRMGSHPGQASQQMRFFTQVQRTVMPAIDAWGPKWDLTDMKHEALIQTCAARKNMETYTFCGEKMRKG